MSERLERLQSTMLDLLLDQGGDAAFGKDPKAFGAARGLEEKDQAALARFQRPLLTYRALARFALTDPLPDCFPITKALLKREGAWRDCVDAFLDSRSIQSPYYRHILPTFVGWLAESGWGAERWPFLLQLAHYEYLELDALRHPDEAAPSGLVSEPHPGLQAVLDGSTRNMAYQWQVQDATEEDPEPAEGPAFLCCHRDPEGSFQVRELDAPASAFLTRSLQGEALGEAALAVGMDWEIASALLSDLQAESAVLGYRQLMRN
ncbi:MAG TPA: putative DNA-binding domain-containing protein [Holophagaceae bacterium]|nr:putative DNA-binding domain-containing protein [Holophagaceae bacterium]